MFFKTMSRFILLPVYEATYGMVTVMFHRRENVVELTCKISWPLMGCPPPRLMVPSRVVVHFTILSFQWPSQRPFQTLTHLAR